MAGSDRTIPVPDDSVEVVTAYIKWTYQGFIDYDHSNESEEAKLPQYIFLAKLYAFGEKILDPQFQNRVVDAIVATHRDTVPSNNSSTQEAFNRPFSNRTEYEYFTGLQNSNRVVDDPFANPQYYNRYDGDMLVTQYDLTPMVQGKRFSPVAEAVNIIYDGTPEDSPARKLLIDIWHDRAHEHWITKFSDTKLYPDFLEDMVKALLRSRDHPSPGRHWGQGIDSGVPFAYYKPLEGSVPPPHQTGADRRYARPTHDDLPPVDDSPVDDWMYGLR